MIGSTSSKLDQNFEAHACGSSQSLLRFDYRRRGQPLVCSGLVALSQGLAWQTLCICDCRSRRASDKPNFGGPRSPPLLGGAFGMLPVLVFAWLSAAACDSGNLNGPSAAYRVVQDRVSCVGVLYVWWYTAATMNYTTAHIKT